IAAVLAAGRVAPVRVRWLLVALLLAGNTYSLVDLTRFASAPRANVAFTLPGVSSAEGVGLVDREVVFWAEGLARRARMGERVVVLQGQTCPSENLSNPVGVLERLYLRVGHAAFREHVIGLGAPGPRYVTVPVTALPSVLDQLTPG